MSIDRVELKLVDGEWQLECGCRFHVWDGYPRTIKTKGRVKLQPGEMLVIGKVAPHLHLCAKHRKQS